jgi:asparagine synthase (glutamine-hydrolysing)
LLSSFAEDSTVDALTRSNVKTSWVDGNFKDALHRYLLRDQQFVVPNDMLVKVDLMSMAHGLEVRTPFLDHNVVEYANGIPSNLKVDRGQGKIILKRAFDDILPKTILNRKKHGFEIPIDRWLRTSLKERVRELLSAKRLESHGLIDQLQVDAIMKSYYSDGKTKHAYLIWALFVFQSWYERNLQ